MNRFTLWAIAWASLACGGASAAADEKTVEIPLKEIWALDMPGTRDVRELDVPLNRSKLSNQELIKRSLIEGIRVTLNKRMPEGESPGPGFVVEGVGEEALKNAHRIFTKNKRHPPRWFPPGKELSLVFYAHNCGRYIRIKSVEQEPKLITVKYQAVRHTSDNVTNHFALIPIGKLDVGNVQVKFIEVQSGKSPPLPDSRRIISDSFSFGVRK